MLAYLLIDRLLKFERRIRDIYLTLSKRSEFSAEVRTFWKEMADEENHHRAFFEQTAGLLNFMQTPPSVAEAVFTRIDEKITAAEAAVQQADLSLDDALRHAIVLEDSELRQLDSAWLEEFHPSAESLLHARIPGEKEHLRRLYEAILAFSSDEALHQQAEALLTTYRRFQADVDM